MNLMSYIKSTINKPTFNSHSDSHSGDEYDYGHNEKGGNGNSILEMKYYNHIRD